MIEQQRQQAIRITLELAFDSRAEAQNVLHVFGVQNVPQIAEEDLPAYIAAVKKAHIDWLLKRLAFVRENS